MDGVKFDFSNLVKMERSEWFTYLDTTPDSESTYNILGIGITELSQSYNPSVESEKWIIEKTARHIHQSNEKQASVSQSIYLGDPCYEFVEAGRDKLNYKTHILDINMKKKVDGDKFYAELSDGLITITSFMSDTATIEYDLYWEGDKTVGSVDMSTGKPVFTPSTQTLAMQAEEASRIVTVDPTTNTKTSTKKTTSEEF